MVGWGMRKPQADPPQLILELLLATTPRQGLPVGRGAPCVTRPAHIDELSTALGLVARSITHCPPSARLTITNSGRAARAGCWRGQGTLTLWRGSLCRIPLEMPLCTSSGRMGRQG